MWVGWHGEYVPDLYTGITQFIFQVVTHFSDRIFHFLHTIEQIIYFPHHVKNLAFTFPLSAFLHLLYKDDFAVFIRKIYLH
jgi:hypothetical protein